MNHFVSDLKFRVNILEGNRNKHFMNGGGASRLVTVWLATRSTNTNDIFGLFSGLSHLTNEWSSGIFLKKFVFCNRYFYFKHMGKRQTHYFFSGSQTSYTDLSH